jgi:hypothetical protein
MENALPRDPTQLLPGTEFGSWRVVSWGGDGSYGVVYRVERIGQEHAGPFALKVAKYPLDRRFERESELLSRIRHPHVPRFETRGWLTFPGGVPFPYVVMEWIEGLPLYEWAKLEPRTSRQVLRVLAQLARALAATHAVEGVHRDVKGDNVSVRAGDGTAVLMDFGTAYFRGAPVFTWQPPPPGTPQYQSPECIRFQVQWLSHPAKRYEAGPADDLYALGVMAYRLVTGGYPPPVVEVEVSEEGTRLIERPLVPVETQVKVSPELAALIARMLSDEPLARGSATEIAEALERAEKMAGPEADQLIGTQPVRSEDPGRTRPASPTKVMEWGQWLAVAAGALLVIGVWGLSYLPSAKVFAAVAEGRRGASQRDSDAVGLGDTMLATPQSVASPGPSRSGIKLDMPKEPFPGQNRPPCQRPEVAINGGCWIAVRDAVPPCGPRAFAWNKGCYVPMFEFPPLPTSGEP